MFDHITVLSTSTIGQLAEVLLFYRKVTLYLSERQIRTLFQKVHPDTFSSSLSSIEIISSFAGLPGSPSPDRYQHNLKCYLSVWVTNTQPGSMSPLL